jgi:hypothetical protein
VVIVVWANRISQAPVGHGARWVMGDSLFEAVGTFHMHLTPALIMTSGTVVPVPASDTYYNLGSFAHPITSISQAPVGHGARWVMGDSLFEAVGTFHMVERIHPP